MGYGAREDIILPQFLKKLIWFKFQEFHPRYRAVKIHAYFQGPQNIIQLFRILIKYVIDNQAKQLRSR